MRRAEWNARGKSKTEGGKWVKAMRWSLLKAPERQSDSQLGALGEVSAYANGQRYLSKNGPERERYSDPDASWGHRSAVSTRKGGGFYGFKVHAAVCARTDLPVAWRVETAGSHESNYVAPLLDAAKDRGFAAETTALDKGYDLGRVYGSARTATPDRSSHSARRPT